MVWQKQKTHKAAEYKVLSIDDAGHGGLNVQELDYTLPLNQSPLMMNMMVKNGVFGKRYGQVTVHEFEDPIYAMKEYADELYLHVGTKIVKYDPATDTLTEILNNEALTKKGVFINYNKHLYYLCNNTFFQYDGTTAEEVEAYSPDVCINRTPDGSYSDIIEDYNRLGAGYKNTFNGDGSSTSYKVMIPKETDDDTTGLDSTPIRAEIDGVEYVEGDGTGKIASVNRSNGTITFNSAPSRGTNNVVITAYKTFEKYENSIKGCKYWAVYGGQNNSRLFLGGNGSATYYFSDVFNAGYFPETNYAVVGNSEKDITGFGAQYNNLIVFKPTEIYAIGYQFGTDTTGEEKAMFFTTQINVDMGCDMPETIQFIDNRLTWGHSQWGICTLCSTVIEDERNVRVISRNINGGYRQNGLLQEPNLKDAIAFSYEGKYVVCSNDTPTSGYEYTWVDSDGNKIQIPKRGYHAYAWDYTNSPYSTSERISPDDAAMRLAWYYWTNVKVDCCQVMDRIFYYGRDNRLCRFSYVLDDFDDTPIESFYQTPLMDFGAYNMLKTIKKVFFEVRGDTPSYTMIKYITDESPGGEADPESLIINEHLWDSFSWSAFGWSFATYAKTFARKCSIKKVNLFAIGLCNVQKSRDMTLSGIRAEYTMVKEIK